MKTKNYFTLVISVVVFALLEAFVWEHILAILITSLAWGTFQFFSNRHFKKQIEQSQTRFENLAKKFETIEAENTDLFKVYATALEEKKKIEETNTLLSYGIKRLEKEIKEFTDKYKAAFTNTNKPYDFPQSEASKKLGACVHNKAINLEKANYDHE